MKRDLLLILGFMVLVVSLLSTQSLAVCPEDTVDSGECDTLYVEILPEDELFMPPLHYARFPIYVTHDVPDPSLDSIAAFVIPLCYTSSNQNASVVIDPAWNNTDLYPFPTTDRSIFRHLEDYYFNYHTNWMMALSEQQMGLEWDTRILDISEGDNFWFATFPTGSQDQKFPQGSRILLAAITFTLDDTTTICIDSCFIPPGGRLMFTRSDASIYIPRHFLPACTEIFVYGLPPYFTECPDDEVHHSNGSFISDDFVVEDIDDPVESISVEFTGSGVENVSVFYYQPPGEYYVEGHVEYDVTDCGSDGGTMTLIAYDLHGNTDACDFNIMLPNNSPVLNLADSWLALCGYTMVLQVSGEDPDGDTLVTIELDAFWYESDSLQPPTNSPSYGGGNPGLFTWVPHEADTGTWICSFSAFDSWGCPGTHQIAIQVGMPFCGDCTGDGSVNVDDVVYLLGYLFRQGPAPDPLCRGDANCDGTADAADMVYLINYFFRYGPAPCFDCCP
jgi:hypothetical protein